MFSPVSAQGPATRSALVVLALFACGDPPTPVAPRREPAPVAASDADATARFEIVDLPALPGKVALYDPSRWRVASGGSFTVLEHAPSSARVVVRVWRAARLVRPAECEAEARIARPSLPRVDPESIVDSLPLDAPKDFSGSLVIGVEPMPNGGAHGFALAVGAAVGRCFVLVFETTADGADAASTVAERLHAAAARIVPSVELSGVDERVQPDRELK
jgi:hypothetical protein